MMGVGQQIAPTDQVGAADLGLSEWIHDFFA